MGDGAVCAAHPACSCVGRTGWTLALQRAEPHLAERLSPAAASLKDSKMYTNTSNYILPPVAATPDSEPQCGNAKVLAQGH